MSILDLTISLDDAVAELRDRVSGAVLTEARPRLRRVVRRLERAVPSITPPSWSSPRTPPTSSRPSASLGPAASASPSRPPATASPGRPTARC